jgi:hypothetical protein
MLVGDGCHKGREKAVDKYAETLIAEIAEKTRRER